jgi:hypothetical protein
VHKFFRTSGPLIAVALLVSACASSPVDRFYGLDGAETIDETLKTCVEEYVGSDAQEEGQSIHTFLNCVFRTPQERQDNSGAADVAEDRFDLRLFRAHAIVGALAVYGNYSMEVDVTANRENAALLLSSIEAAEIELWKANSAVKTRAHGYELQQYVDFFDRIRLVYKVAEDAARPGALRARNFAVRIAGAIAGQNPLAVFSTIKEAREGIGRALTARRYSAAYIQGIQQFIVAIKTRSTNRDIVTTDDWDAVDNFYLKAACDGLAQTAGVAAHHCIPDRT